MRKIVGIFAVLIIALMVAGFAVAYWTDKLTITGTVNTGTFGWEWTDVLMCVSEDTKGIVTLDFDTADTNNDGHDDSISFTATDVYPCTDIGIWVTLHFWGNVPGKITAISVTGTLNDEPLTAVPDWVDIYCEIVDLSCNIASQTGYSAGDKPSIDELISKLIGTQWHQSDYITVKIFAHWVEEGMLRYDGSTVPDGVEVPQGATLEFTVTVEGIQYNAIS